MGTERKYKFGFYTYGLKNIETWIDILLKKKLDFCVSMTEDRFPTIGGGTHSNTIYVIGIDCDEETSIKLKDEHQFEGWFRN